MESQLTLTVLLGFGIPYIPYQKLLGLFLVCTSLTLIRYFYSWSGRGLNSVESQLRLTVLLPFGLSEIIRPISGVHLSDRYFYSSSIGVLNSLESQLTLTVLLGFRIPYIPYQMLLCLFLVCTSLTLSGISTLGQEGLQTLWSLSSH